LKLETTVSWLRKWYYNSGIGIEQLLFCILSLFGAPLDLASYKAKGTP